MATAHQGAIKMMWPASGDISSYRWKFMILSSGELTVATAITDHPVGVLQDKPAAQGRAGEVVVVGPTKMVAGEALTTPGTLISTDTSGRAIAVTPGSDTTAYILGHTVGTAGAANDILEVFVNCAAPGRAA